MRSKIVSLFKISLSARIVLFVACLVASTVCLGVGSILAGQRLLSLIAWLSALPWLMILLPARKAPIPRPLPWLPPACLVLSVGLAAVGLLLGAPPLLMILASTTALGAWDLALLDRSLGEVTQGSHPEGVGALEARRARSLALALGLGLLLAGLGRFLSFQLPFGAMAVLVILDLLALTKAWDGFQQGR